MSRIKTYRTCFVPLCKNTTKRTPEKVFVTVPKEVKRRKQWFDSARRDLPESSTSNYFCCEDHFNLREDMDNYLYYTSQGGPARMKLSAVPHKFDCQPNRKRSADGPLRPVAEKRRRLQEINEMLAAEIPPCPSKNPPSTFAQLQGENETLDSSLENINPNSDLVSDSRILDTATVKVDAQTQTEYNTTKHSVGVQINIRQRYRSIATTCKIIPSFCHTSSSPIKTYNVVDSATSPIKLLSKIKTQETDLKSASTLSQSISEVVSSNDYSEPTEVSNSSNTDTPQKKYPDAVKLTNYFISTNMKSYIGIPNEWAFLLDILSTDTKIKSDNIKLCLMKIRTQDTFQRLGEQFGMTVSNASFIFRKTIPILAHMLKAFIFFPDRNAVRQILPIALRGTYSHVQSIVDALEIQIEKPTDPVNQALTWSEYKKCNTLKYLISCSPDGFINYISTGYGGRISDVLLFEKCGILDKLPENSGVMADRGFKNIQSLLSIKNCELLKPPSVSSSVKPQKSEVLETKRIASLRIHVERVIGRLREFDFLKPHAVINHSMLSYTDDIITIASALVNLQSPIIKM